jgi:hypothetical protein
MEELTKLKSLPQLDYTLPKWKELVRYENAVRENYSRQNDPETRKRIFSFHTGAVDAIQNSGQEGLEEAFTLMKIAYHLSMV